MSAEPKSFCTFVVDGLLVGVDVRRVEEVLNFQKLSRVPLAAPVISGVLNLRGRIVTAFDLRRCLELSERAPGVLPLNVVVRSQDRTASLLVDKVGDVIEVSDDMYERPPETLRGAARELILGAYKLAGGLLLVLDADKLVHLQWQGAKG